MPQQMVSGLHRFSSECVDVCTVQSVRLCVQYRVCGCVYSTECVDVCTVQVCGCVYSPECVVVCTVLSVRLCVQYRVCGCMYSTGVWLCVQ